MCSFFRCAVDYPGRQHRFEVVYHFLSPYLNTRVRIKIAADETTLVPSIIGTFLCVAAWGFFLYQGVTDPLGGVNTLWPLFGISNQMLAAVALLLATVVLFRMKRERFAWVTLIPTAWLLACTVTASLMKLFSANPSVGFLAHARRYGEALQRGEVLAPAKSTADMQRILFNDRVDAALCALFLLVVLSILFYAVRTCLAARRIDRPTVHELPLVAAA